MFGCSHVTQLFINREMDKWMNGLCWIPQWNTTQKIK